MHAVTVLSGPALIVTYQSALSVALFGLMVGVPAREAWCDPHHRFLPWFHLFERIYADGGAYRVDADAGSAWVFRLADESAVGIYFEPEPSRPLPAPLPGLAPLVLVG